MFQGVLITKSEKDSKMHEISIPECEIKSILYEEGEWFLRTQIHRCGGKQTRTSRTRVSVQFIPVL